MQGLGAPCGNAVRMNKRIQSPMLPTAWRVGMSARVPRRCERPLPHAACSALLHSSGTQRKRLRAGPLPAQSVDDLSTDFGELFDQGAVACPFGTVQALISAPGRPPLLTAGPTETLQGIVPTLAKVTGLPVVNRQGKVIGVVSRKDVIAVRKAGGSLEDFVSDHMTAPAVTLPASATVQEAADMMLARKIRRLPIVDERGAPIGVVSRSDVFRPLMQAKYEEFNSKEVAAMATGAGLKFSWDIKYLYDGDCNMCLSLKMVLERQDRNKRIRFVNIADPDYDPSVNMGIEFEDAMSTIHAVRPDGTVLLGTEALRALFDTVGLGWAVALSEVPLLARLLEMVYDFLSANRIKFSSALDGIIAVKRLELSKTQIETCGDIDEGCVVEWD